jgi:predicted ATPase/class 3 adenylate cyclase
MEQLPDGVVTFLFTDVQGSTQLWEEAPDSMMEALRHHDEVIDQAVEKHHGVSVKPRGEGDSRFVVFRVATDAARAIGDIQLGLAESAWPTPRPLLVRAALHTGVADLELGDYYGSAVNRAARLRAIAHGGQTLVSRSTFDLMQDGLPDGLTLTDLGFHRLKDLTRPEHVFQLDIDGLGRRFPRLRSLDAVPNNLPEQLTELIGRSRELSDIDRLLARTRLLTILAPGGTGKTRLAIQAAADHTSRFPDGVFLVALADITLSADIVQTVAKSVGIALASERVPQAQLLDYLAQRRVLLVFDNFEHLPDAAGIVTDILHAAPQVVVIATSRMRLNLTGETIMTLGGLDTKWSTPEDALQTSGVELFLDAARRSRPGLSLQPDDFEPLARILALTGGMPLAILLAAAWSNMLSIAEIADEIQENLDFLESDAGDVPDRHRSIRAVFDYTWELLDPAERDVFAALSVFRGGFTRDAAKAIAGASLKDLAALTNKSLVTPDPNTGRYGVHELLRQYAQADLERVSQKDSTVTDKHSDYYASLTAEAFADVFDDERVALAKMEDDFDNIRLAWRHCIAKNRSASIHMMLGGLWLLTEIRSWYRTGVDLFAEAVDGLDGTDDGIVVARAGATALHSVYSTLLGRQPEQATEAAGRAVDELRDRADPLTMVIALVQWGICLLYLRRFEELIAVHREAESISTGASPREWPTVPIIMAGFTNVPASVALTTGDIVLAKRLLEETRQVLEPRGELYYMSWNLSHRARVALVEGRTDEAIRLFSQSADCSRQVGFNRGLQFSLSAMGDVQLANGALRAAERSLVEALDAAEKTGMVIDMLGGLVKIATVFAATDRKAQGVKLLSTVITEPASEGQQLAAKLPIRDLASAQLDKLRSELDPEEYEPARASGASTTYGMAVKELIDTLG